MFSNMTYLRQYDALLCLVPLLLFQVSSNGVRKHSISNDYAQVASTIVVDQSGAGNFTSVQQAIDSVPSNNNQWICIHVKPGIYKEKIVIPKEKPYIYLEGEDSSQTFIQWGDHGGVATTSTVTFIADHLVATHITFKNTYNALLPKHQGGFNNPIEWAPAAMVMGDKVAFYGCGFVSLQDTLCDRLGRHYFESCYIEGAVDFIWGYGRSQYKDCTIHSKCSVLGLQPGFITAQGRNSSDEQTGFVFLSGSVTGDGSTYLGRAWGRYSTVIFYQTDLSEVVTPLGWEAWNYKGQEEFIRYVEEGCTGSGSDKSGRVPWMTTMDPRTLETFINTNIFINEGGWLERQPQHN